MTPKLSFAALGGLSFRFHPKILVHLDDPASKAASKAGAYGGSEVGAMVGHMVGPPIIGGVVGNIVGERVGEDLIRETGLDRDGVPRAVVGCRDVKRLRELFTQPFCPSLNSISGQCV